MNRCLNLDLDLFFDNCAALYHVSGMFFSPPFVKACDWGITHEPRAKQEYTEKTSVDVQERGVFLSNSGLLGGSPDGTVSDECIIEVKLYFVNTQYTRPLVLNLVVQWLYLSPLLQSTSGINCN